MTELMQLAMPDGETIWAQIAIRHVGDVEPTEGPSDVGIGEKAVKALVGFRETLNSVASNVYEGLRKVSPDEVSLELGLEFAVAEEGVVAALVGLAGNATVKVTVTWSGGGPKPPANIE